MTGQPAIDRQRRRFLSETVPALCAVAAAGPLLYGYGRQSLAAEPQALRPPGALADEAFAAACSRCGLCVEACPYDTLKLARWLGPVAIGTPYFEARQIPCEMCDDIPCTRACPTGALDPALEQIDDARMGLAVLIDEENCLNAQGLRCDVCYRVCPVIDRAITLELSRNTRTGKHAIFMPTVHSDHCTGCGKCEKACVLTEAAIKVLPLELARGQLGDHYRWGWQEKEKAGHGLLPQEPLDLPDRRPESAPLEGL